MRNFGSTIDFVWLARFADESPPFEVHGCGVYTPPFEFSNPIGCNRRFRCVSDIAGVEKVSTATLWGVTASFPILLDRFAPPGKFLWGAVLRACRCSCLCNRRMFVHVFRTAFAHVHSSRCVNGCCSYPRFLIIDGRADMIHALALSYRGTLHCVYTVGD